MPGRRVVVGVLAGMLLAACGSPGESGPTGDVGTEAAPRVYTFPINEYLGGSEDPAADLAAAREAERLHQEAVATCMKEQGFDHHPVLNSFWSSADVTTDAELGTRAYAEKYGFEIHLRPPSEVQPPPVDPNQALVESMTGEEREAYEAALYGDPTVDGAAGQGCLQQESASTGWGQQLPVHDPEWQEVWAELDRRTAQLERDPDLVAARESWATCMAEAGYPGVTVVHELREDLEDRWGRLHGVQTTRGTDGAATSGVQSGFVPDPTAIEAFKRDERAAAVAHFDCSADLDAVWYAKQVELQTAFIEEFRPVLERQRDARTAGGDGD